MVHPFVRGRPSDIFPNSTVGEDRRISAKKADDFGLWLASELLS
jgi:hypothetical protein